MRTSAWLYLLQQTLCSVCLMQACGLCAGLRSDRLPRTLLCAALLSLLTLGAQGHAPPLRLLLALPCCLSPLIIWPDAPRRLRPRLCALGLLLPMTLSGLMRLLSTLPLPGTLLLPGGCLLLTFLSRVLLRQSPLPRCISVEIRLGKRNTTLTALVDSGNLLRDAITGLPVIVISRRAAARLMRLPPEGTLLPGMRLMSIRTVSGPGLMTILRPDAVRIRGSGGWLAVRALIGLSPCGSEGFQALLPACIVPSGLPDTTPAISQGG